MFKNFGEETFSFVFYVSVCICIHHFENLIKQWNFKCTLFNLPQTLVISFSHVLI